MRVQKTYFMLMAQDMDRALAFYEGALGLRRVFSSPFWSELKSGGAVVALHGGGDGSRQRTGLGFEVDDLEAACAAVAAHGGHVERAPEDRPRKAGPGEPIRLAEVRDPEGNVFSLAQPDPQSD